MSVIDFIKGPKKLKPTHWRFKIVEWVLGKDDVPHYMYSHYCPLFHASNIFAFLTFVLPVIPVYKMCSTAFKTVKKFFADEMKKADKEIENEKQTRYNGMDIEEGFKKYLENHYDPLYLFYSSYHEYITCYRNDFDQDKHQNDELLSSLNKIFDEHVQREDIKREQRKQAKEEARKKRQERLYPIIYASNILFKTIFVLLIPVVFYYVLIPAVFLTLSTFWFILELMLSINLWSFLVGLVEFTLTISVISVVCYFVFKSTSEKLSGLAEIVVEMADSIFNSIANICESIYEFVAMFYKDNCPPIIMEEEK